MDLIRDHDCFFTAGQKADGIPFMYNMHKTTGISGGVGPMGSIKSRSVSIPVPRSKKAQTIHLIGFIFKAIFFIIALLALQSGFLQDQGLILKILIPASILLTGGLVIHLVLPFYQNKIKVFLCKGILPCQQVQKKRIFKGFSPDDVDNTCRIGGVSDQTDILKIRLRSSLLHDRKPTLKLRLPKHDRMTA